MRVAIHQPNYIPWCGFFAKMRAVDVFVFLDDAAVSPGQSYFYRSQIRTDTKPVWLSVPCRRHTGQAIREVEFADETWAASHLGRLRTSYSKAPYFREIMSLIEPLFSISAKTVADFNISIVEAISGYLGIQPRVLRSSSLRPLGSGDDRLISILGLLGGDTYVSGKGGTKYQDPAKFKGAGVNLEVREYFPICYRQIHGDFLPGLSIVDTLFNCGPQAEQFLTYENPETGDRD